MEYEGAAETKPIGFSCDGTKFGCDCTNANMGDRGLKVFSEEVGHVIEHVTILYSNGR